MGREDEIRAIAYRIWEEEGGCDGCDYDHWLKAEMIWEDKQKNEVVSIANQAKSTQTAKQGKNEGSQDVELTPEEPQRIHHSLILKVLGK